MGLPGFLPRSALRRASRPCSARTKALLIPQPRTSKSCEVLSLDKHNVRRLPKERKKPVEDEGVLSGPEYQRLIEHELPSDVRVHVVLLAGGAGQPDNPLARTTNTAELPIGGNRRLIDVAIGAALVANFMRIHVLTQYNGYHLQKYISSEYRMDRLQPHQDPAFVQTLACHQTPESKDFHRGSGDALRASMPHIAKSLQGLPQPDYLVIASGQDLHDVDLRQFVAFARAHKADVAIAVQPHAFHGAHKMGVCTVNPQSHRIEQFVERPSVPQLRRMLAPQGTLTVSLGMYVIKRSVLARILGADRGQRMAHIGADIVPYAVGMGMNIVAYKHRGMFQKCTELRAFFDACLDFARAPELPPAFRFMRELQGRREAHALPPAQCRNTELTATVVSEAVQLLGGAFDTAVVGQRMFIGAGARVRNTVFYGLSQLQDAATHARERAERGHARGVGRNVTLENAIVCADACIGDDVSLTNAGGVRTLDRSGDGIVIHDGVVVVLQGAVIPDGFTL